MIVLVKDEAEAEKHRVKQHDNSNNVTLVATQVIKLKTNLIDTSDPDSRVFSCQHISGISVQN